MPQSDYPTHKPEEKIFQAQHGGGPSKIPGRPIERPNRHIGTRFKHQSFCHNFGY